MAKTPDPLRPLARLAPLQLPRFLQHFFTENALQPGFFWLDSGDGQYLELGRFSYLGMRPDCRLQYFACGELRSTAFNCASEVQSRYCTAEESLRHLETLARRYAGACTAPKGLKDGKAELEVPDLQAGLVGAFSYEFAYQLQPYFSVPMTKQAAQAPKEETEDRSRGMSELLWDFAAYAAVLAVDLRRGYIYLQGESDSLTYKLMYQRTEYTLAKVNAPAPVRVSGLGPALGAANAWTLSAELSFDDYRQKFRQVKEYLRQGETYQLNLAQRLQLGCLSDANNIELYWHLRNRHPVPYGAYFSFGVAGGFTDWERSLLCFSPERFFRYSAFEGKIWARPMKGTRPRGLWQSQDRRRYRELCASAKERAELLMICDLLRSDLYQICEPASVQVQPGARESWPFCVEAYPSVWQQTAALCGHLRPALAGRGQTSSEQTGLLARILQALFPCGSITGAPKLRAMELIGQLEGEPRRWYSGNLGFIDGSGNMEFNVLIRSFYAAEPPGTATRLLHYHVGGALIWDSEVEAEWREQEAKCQFFLRSLGLRFPAE